MVQNNTSIPPTGYVPILKSKQGELGALASLTPANRIGLVPMIEVADDARIPGVALAWQDATNAVLIHPLNLEGVDESAWATEILKIFAEARSHGIKGVPVATVEDSPEVRDAIRQVVATDGLGVCIRVDAEDVALASQTSVAADLNQLLSDVGSVVASCDLVLDVGLTRDSVVTRVTTAEAGLHVLPSLAQWRSLVTCFSAFPESLTDVAAKGAVTILPRDDAIAYATLLGRSPARTPTFGDYTIGVPFYADIPWAPIPAVRYAESDRWIIHRGTTKNNRSEQYVQLTRDLISSGQFAGAGASAGDQYLSDVAAGVDGPGNPMTYVRAGVSRHLAVVLDRLATLGVP